MSETQQAALDAFSRALAEHARDYDDLLHEKRLGWNSDAVSHAWAQRDALCAQTKRLPNDRLHPTTAKYVRFYREWMPKLAPVFRRRTTAADDDDVGSFAAADSPRTFIDLGSSPGGMCEFLVGDLGWRGHAHSLAADGSDKGFGMLFSHPMLEYHDTDLAVSGSWRAVVDAAGPDGVDFVNGGIVVDRGQTTSMQMGDEGQAIELVFVTILINELLVGLHALRPGGALYFAFQSANYGLLFKVLSVLQPCFRAFRATPTFAKGRTPLYCFCDGFVGCGEPEAVAAADFLVNTPIDVSTWGLWHLTDWSDDLSRIHAGALAADLAYVWRSQEEHLRAQRLDAERVYEAHRAKSRSAGGPDTRAEQLQPAAAERAESDLGVPRGRRFVPKVGPRRHENPRGGGVHSAQGHPSDAEGSWRRRV